MASKYTGISTKINPDGTKAIMVRFQHQGTRYPVKNFTSLFGCKTETQAYNKLQEIKLEISKGNNPFKTTSTKLDDIWDDWYNRKVKSGTWGESTQKNNRQYYNDFIRPTLGKLNIDKIKYKDVRAVADMIADKNKNFSAYYKNKIRSMMLPLVEESIKRGEVEENVFAKLETIKGKATKPVTNRTKEKPLDIVRRLYAAIPKYSYGGKRAKEVRATMYMALMTAHRIGEIKKTKIENIYLDEMKVIAPASITKTKEDYHYPLPEELVDYIKDCTDETCFIKNQGSNHTIFQKWLEFAEVHTYDGKYLSWHDTRRLMQSVMVMDCKIDSALADACLEHKPQGVQAHYMHFSYEDKVEAYNKYWDMIRN